jgi:hypothetical protein
MESGMGILASVGIFSQYLFRARSRQPFPQCIARIAGARLTLQSFSAAPAKAHGLAELQPLTEVSHIVHERRPSVTSL